MYDKITLGHKEERAMRECAFGANFSTSPQSPRYKGGEKSKYFFHNSTSIFLSDFGAFIG